MAGVRVKGARRLEQGVALVLLGGMFLWLFYRPLFWGEIFFRRDIVRLFLPAKEFLASGLRRFELLHWFPFDALGVPLVAAPLLSVFHPTTLLYVALPFRAAFVAQSLLGLAGAVGSAYALARRLALRPLPSAVTAAAYGYSGYLLGLMEYTFSLLAAAALPLLLWALLQRRAGAGRIAAIAMSCALILLAGDPVIALTGALMGLPWVVGGTARSLRRAWDAVLGGALGMMLAAVQVLPALLLLPESPRQIGGTLSSASYWRLGLPEALQLVWHPRDVWHLDFVESLYVGAPVLALALVGAAWGFRRTWRFTLVAALSFALATGSATPLWSLFSATVPLWKSFQYPIKAVLPGVLVLAVLAGHGARLVSRALARWAPRLPALQLATLVLVLLDLASHQRGLAPTLPADVIQVPALAQALRAHGVGPAQANYWPQERFDIPADEAHMTAYGLASLYTDTGALWGLPSSNYYFASLSRRYYELALQHPAAWRERLLGVFNTRFFVMPSENVLPAQRAAVVAHDPRWQLDALELKHLPRAYFTTRAVLKSGDAVDYLLSPAFRPGREVVLEPGPSPVPFPQGDGSPARPLGVQRTSQTVEVEGAFPSPGYVVLNESYYRGVSAKLDGREVPVYPANHLVRAVVVPEGRHTVSFSYVTPGLHLGAAMSLLGLGVWLGLILWATCRGRQREFRAGIVKV